MNLMGMRFKDFTWRDNPTSLTVTEERSIRETALPYRGTVAEDLGRKRRRVTGEGYFVGEDCWERWNALRELYSRGGAGYLQLPGQTPFPAVLDALKLIGVAGEDLVKYGFSFTEQWEDGRTGPDRCTAAGGESLWDFAWKWGVSVEALTAANPHLRDIGLLAEGEKVTAP